MNESYCGNNCEACEMRQELNCRGCKQGPGRAYSGWCEIAACCREKSHATCHTCVQLGFGCGKHGNHKDGPQKNAQKFRADAARKRKLDQNASILGTRIWLLFWLMICGLAADLIAAIGQAAPGLRWIGLVLLAACNLVSAGVLCSLGTVNKGFRGAGICTFIGVTILVANHFVPEGRAGLQLLVAAPGAIAGLYGRYAECMAQADELRGLDEQLAEKWRKLWKHWAWTAWVLVGSVVLMLILPVLGLVVLVVGVIAVAVLTIQWYVYRYRTARRFREYVSVGGEII